LAFARIVAPLLLAAWLSGCSRAASPVATEERCGALQPVPARGTAVTDGARYYSDFEGQEQKVGLIYKTSVAMVRSARIILGAHEREFAGRPPVEVELAVTVNGAQFHLILVLIHAKAGSGQPDWEQRNAAAAVLKDYLDRTHPASRVMVVGDFNDDVDVSITPPNPSPYMRFVGDSTAYFIPTKALSEIRKASTVAFTEMIDHHLVTNELKEAYLPGSAEVFPADQYLASYQRTTSDHYPVLVRYLPRRP
jgi:endonuclease/exonuclease/phosphatase family metal-dependent hydrolase